MAIRPALIAVVLIAGAGLLLLAEALGLPRAAALAMWTSLGLGLAAISAALAWQAPRGFAIALAACVNFAAGALAFHLARNWLGGP